MKCPECGSECWRNEVDIGVGVQHDHWRCTECSWDEQQAFPMTDMDWSKWLEADDWQ